MNKVRVIDLLNKIANGEEVPLIKIYGRTLRYSKEEHWFDDIDDESYCRYKFDFEELNDEVEIIEEDKKIEKLKVEYAPDIEEKIFWENGDKPNHCILGDAGTELLINKINEIIDYINKEK